MAQSTTDITRVAEVKYIIMNIRKTLSQFFVILGITNQNGNNKSYN